MPTSVPDCPFCAIAAGDDDDARVVFRGRGVTAFFPTEPASLGHTLVIVNRHTEFVWELSEDEQGALIRCAVRVARAMRSSLQPDGVNLIQSNGEAATQTVPHTHLHVVPRWANDSIGRIWPPETNYTEGAKNEAWAKLRSAARDSGSE